MGRAVGRQGAIATGSFDTLMGGRRGGGQGADRTPTAEAALAHPQAFIGRWHEKRIHIDNMAVTLQCLGIRAPDDDEEMVLDWDAVCSEDGKSLALVEPRSGQFMGWNSADGRFGAETAEALLAQGAWTMSESAPPPTRPGDEHVGKTISEVTVHDGGDGGDEAHISLTLDDGSVLELTGFGGHINGHSSGSYEITDEDWHSLVGRELSECSSDDEDDDGNPLAWLTLSDGSNFFGTVSP